MNKVILVGRLTRDVEVRFANGGLAIGKTAIATDRKYKTQSGEMKTDVMFIDITFFGKTAEFASKYFRKGSGILVEGRLSFDQWQDQSGNKRSKHSVAVENVEFLPQNNNQDQNSYNGGGAYGNGNSYNNNNGGYNSNQAPQQQQNSYQQQPQQGGYNANVGGTAPAPQQEQARPQQQGNNSIPEIDIDDMDDQVPF